TIGNAIGPANDLDFIAGLNGSDGSGKFAKSLDTATGALLSIGANPNSATNRIAFCGKALDVAPFIPGAVGGGLKDIVIRVLDSAGNIVWAKQIGTPGNEECNAVAVDDAGDVYAPAH